jgi:hypothetical protein
MEDGMKRNWIMVLLLCMAGSLVWVSAQEGSAASQLDKSATIRTPSNLYPVRLDVLKIFSHSEGYRIVYRKGMVAFADIHVPISWFVAGGKAQMIKGRGAHYPYVIIYFNDQGEFSHLKLYAMANMLDETWGIMAGNPGDAFKIDTIKLDS